jgi:DNA polymerase elongation subunit (family B)
MTAKDIFKAYKEGVLNSSKEGQDLLAVCGNYCIVDSILVQRLFEHCDIWIETSEMSKICNVPVEYLYLKGQQIRIFSKIYKYCYDNNITVEQNIVTDGSDDYMGATVLKPVSGIYNNVVPFDFSSLYPSLIIAYNIDYNTFVPEGNPMIPDEKCNVIEWSQHTHCTHDLIHIPNSKEYKCEENRYRFLKEPKGVLPTIIQDLLDSRANIRKNMKDVSDINFKTILDKRQTAYKVVANSMYGSMGVSKGYLPFKIGAMCVTAMGRKHLIQAVNVLENEYGSKNIYSDTDSAYASFPKISMDKLWEYAIWVEKDLDKRKIFPAPMKLSFERKIYQPFLILTKKRYMYKEINEKGDVSSDLGKKGVLLTRRDNSKFVRDIYEKVILMIFEKYHIDDIYISIINDCTKCFTKCYIIDDFVITKAVNDESEYKVRELSVDEKKRNKRLRDLNCTEEEYENRALPAHVQLASKLRSRGIRIDVGQRIEYVITNLGGPKSKLFDKIEDPDYVIEHKNVINIDSMYYVKALIEPIDQVLNIFNNIDFMKNHYKIREKQQKLFNELQSYFLPKLIFE